MVTVFAQPLLALFVVGHVVGHCGPEAVGVVGLYEVHQFVQDDVVLYMGWGEEEAGRKVDIAVAGAAAPVAGVVLEGDAAYRAVDRLAVEVMDAFFDFFAEVGGEDSGEQGLHGFCALHRGRFLS